jgi:glycosyltransferase involved in cell wall biosynthesis
VRLAHIANHFGARYHHSVYASDGVYDTEKLIRPDVPVTKLEVKINKRLGLRNVPLYRRILREARCDLAITYNWGAIEWAFATRLIPGLRHIHIEDGFGPEEATWQLPRRVRFRRLALTSASTTVVVPSHVLHNIALQVWRLSAASVELIPNGVDLKRFAFVDVAQARALAGKADGEILIGTVATIRPEKNLSLLIRAFAKLPLEPATRLFIVGSGSETERLKATARDAGVQDRVVFFGFASKPELILRAFDVFAMSSITEQMPLGLLEAMACALPVAATAVGDIGQMVAEENRPYLVRSEALDSLAGALWSLVQDPGLRSRIGHLNLAKAVAHYDQEAMFERYGRLFG